ncbi:Pre-mRNA-splicing factor syf2 [Coniochaeta pulveracea]|uniref:Pre-mRNA-splicing factor SYF2 n=1 Tax=Coniochaeta pulveracea TaxID=177199 RepID=A0A420XXC5_9PEZI|nr:Pre-mRNA-splicing factor syf2 [Coniochaeta pulveracea]
MPAAKRRKTTASGKSNDDEHVAQVAVEASASGPAKTQIQPEENPDSVEEPTQQPTEEATSATSASSPKPESSDAPSNSESASAPTEDAAAKAKERMARFRALQARAKTSSDQNLKEATKESQRLAAAADPSQLTALGRRHAIAAHKLLKADVEESGEDFERKRAWDWTVEESEAWDKRVKKKSAHKDDNAFQDYRREAQKVYKRQVKNMGGPDLETYTKQKMAAIEKAAAAGTLEIVETEDGEMIAVDKDGTFYSTADSTSFAEHKADKAAVDRLVADLQKAEAVSLKKRKERMANSGDDADVTYINEKNKQFNQKLGRFYNKYTAEIRDSFERGTMI